MSKMSELDHFCDINGIDKKAMNEVIKKGTVVMLNPTAEDIRKLYGVICPKKTKVKLHDKFVA